MNVLALETACIRQVALSPPTDYGFHLKLPPELARKAAELCEEVELFIALHHRLVNIERNWIVVNEDCQIDWTSTLRRCIASTSTEQAFLLAAVNALQKECALIWQDLSVCSRKKLQDSKNAVIRSAAWEAAGFHYLIFYDHVCCIATRNGWPNALKLWLGRVPAEEYDRLCVKLTLVAICHQHYHLLEILPKYEEFPFTFIFQNGHVDGSFVLKLANTPVRWRSLTMDIARAFLRWAPRREIDRIRLEFYSSLETAAYGRYVDALLKGFQKFS